MELGILEMASIEDIKKQAKRRFEIVNTVCANNPDNVPEGFTAIYLRDNFFHVLPDEFVPTAKQIFSNGFEHDFETRTLTAWIGHGGLFTIGLELIDQYRQWCDKYL